MSILTTDIKFYLSGGASNSNSLLSLGGAKSSTISAATIFDSVDGSESLAGDVEYRCVYVKNEHATILLERLFAWIVANTPSPSTVIALGLGTSAINAVEPAVANESTAPTGVTFLAAAIKASGVDCGDIPAGQTRALWLRRTVTAGATVLASDPFTLRGEGETV